MKTLLSIFFILLFGKYVVSGQQVSGYVIDANSGENLPYANIYSPDKHIGVISNSFGYFNINVSEKAPSLIFSYTGYKSYILDLSELKDTVIKVALIADNNLDEIVVEGKSNSFTNKPAAIGSIELPIKQIQSAPALFAEPDVMKVLQLMPGIQSTKAGFSSLVVRGGKPDQNIILLDGVPIYNISHLYGIFSVINENAIQSVNVIKGNYPAQYGGRLSSLVDITLREGNINCLKGEIGVGTIGGKFALEGPIFDKKTTFYISGRRTLLDIFSTPYQAISTKETNGYFFGDINTKISRKISERDKLFFSFYYGKDSRFQSKWGDITAISGTDYQRSTEEGYKWGNYTFSLRWNHLFSPKMFANFTMIGSNFYLGNYTERNLKSTVTSKSYKDNVTYSSGINDIGIKSDVDFYINNNHKMTYGCLVVNHYFMPGATVFISQNVFSDNSVISSTGPANSNLLESSAYLQDEWKITKALKVGLGLRASFLGAKDSSFFFLEPRLSASVKLGPKTTLLTAYNQNSQFMHLLRSSVLELPTDLWIPASGSLLPEKAMQWSTGIEYLMNNGLSFTGEVYYKEMQNILEYLEGSTISTPRRNWEEEVQIGRGWSYGAEFLLKKMEGKTTGWIGYTLSWSYNQFDGLNQGNAFPSTWDRRHDFVIALQNRFNKKWDLGMNWVYNTGTPYTIPIYRSKEVIIKFPAHQIMDDSEISGPLNHLYLPAYHRLDISVNYTKASKKHKNREHLYSLSLYNVYNRKNVYYKGYVWGRQSEASIFLFLPSLSYKLKF